MKRLRSLFLRAATMSVLVLATMFVTAPVYAVDAVPPPRITNAVRGACFFQGATIEGTALAVGAARHTGISCTVYENGAFRGGCGMILNGSSASCASVTQPVIGPPVVCTYAFAVFDTYTAEYSDCS